MPQWLSDGYLSKFFKQGGLLVGCGPVAQSG